ncbi:MAG: DinB family protein [Candidatus Hodarchaeota archaeon]
MANMGTDEKISVAIHEQYGAAIEMLEQVITKCPEEVWDDKTLGPPFWQVVYHTMFYLDWYLARSKGDRESFTPKYETERFENLDNLPKVTLNCDQMLSYLFEIKDKAKQRFENLTVAELNQPPIYEWHGVSVLSSLLYNIRHVMLHIGALNFRLLRKSVELDNWVSWKLIEE